MINILVLGGGFAGVWSAASAVRAARESGVPASELRVRLVSDRDDMVIRPRLYERDPARMRVSLDRVLRPIGVERVGATVIGIDTSARTVEAVSSEGQTIALPYDRLVLATGSRVRATHPSRGAVPVRRRHHRSCGCSRTPSGQACRPTRSRRPLQRGRHRRRIHRLGGRHRTRGPATRVGRRGPTARAGGAG